MVYVAGAQRSPCVDVGTDPSSWPDPETLDQVVSSTAVDMPSLTGL